MCKVNPFFLDRKSDEQVLPITAMWLEPYIAMLQSDLALKMVGSHEVVQKKKKVEGLCALIKCLFALFPHFFKPKKVKNQSFLNWRARLIQAPPLFL